MISFIDIAIVIVYLVGCVAVGLLARGSRANAREYFTAGGGLGSFFGTIVVGLSLAASFFSGISFISYPSVAYSTGVVLFMGVAVVCMPVTYLVLRYWFLPRYLAAGCVYPYDVIERRFGRSTRTIAAFLFICMRLGWMAALIYAPTLAIMAMAGLDNRWFWPIVVVVGASGTLYTVLSGIRGVIVVDAIQIVVVAIGIAFTIAFALSNVPVPLHEAVHELRASGRLTWLNFSFDPTRTLTFWTVAIGVTVANLANYVADQMSLQRYLATGDAKGACRSFVVNVIGVLTVLALLVGVGLSLYVYFAHANDPNLPTRADKVFPYFVARRLPRGLCGMLLAALLAATMSTFTSGINALAGVVTLDFRNRFGRAMSDEAQVRFAKFASLAIGVVATFATGIVARLGTMFELTQVILGVFAGPLLACVVVSVSRIRCRGWAMSVGLIAGSGVGVAAVFTHLAVLWIAPLAAGTTLLIALALTMLSGRTVVACGFEVVVPGREASSSVESVVS